MAYGNIFEQWRACCLPTWNGYVKHEFVEKLRDGSLPWEAFVHYLKQDYLFLIHFSRAWALAITKTDQVDEMRLAASMVHGLINEEISLHIRTCQHVGISEHDIINTSERPENLAYTRFVLDAGHSGDLLDLLSALAPCVLGYGEIGKRLEVEATSTRYHDWISTYASEEYQKLCHDVGLLIDHVAQRRLGNDVERNPRWHDLSNRFAMASQLEIQFWNMGLQPDN
ncbi:MAG: thiaminase II [Alphaproteobacteria bacterium]|nr:thiaminase II [Alphaproteobacteria bacterium]